MQERAVAGSPDGLLGRAAALVQRRPEAFLWSVLAFHLVVWTALPILLCPNLQLDLAEDLAMGREWQLGYWKHPPLPWWLADLAYRATGLINSIYLLGPLSAVVCMYAVWRLAREVVAPVPALVAVCALEGIHFYNFSVPKFAHDQMQLPFWALTGWLFYRAVTGARLRDWMLAGACLALAFWSKYAAFALAATLGLVLLLDPHARKAWRTPGPYAMAAAFLLVLAPNLWWLVDSGFQPFRYVEWRAVSATRWYHYVTFPLQWTVSQLFFLLPAAALLVLALRGPAGAAPAVPAPADAFARRYVTALALGPFAVTTVVALVLGRLPVAMWGYPLWSFLPLAAVMWYGRAIDPLRLRRFVAGLLVVLVAIPAIYAAIELFEPYVRDRRKATIFPGRALAETITRAWHAKTGQPLRYVAGGETAADRGEFAANTIAVYSPDRPQVIVHGDLRISPWINREDLARRGAVLVWDEPGPAARLPAALRAAFPAAEVQPLLSLPRLTRAKVQPATVGYAFVPPRP